MTNARRSIRNSQRKSASRSVAARMAETQPISVTAVWDAAAENQASDEQKSKGGELKVHIRGAEESEKAEYEETTVGRQKTSRSEPRTTSAVPDSVDKRPCGDESVDKLNQRRNAAKEADIQTEEKIPAMQMTPMMRVTTRAESKLLTAEGAVDGEAVLILIDSGATDNFVSKTWLKDRANQREKLTQPIEVKLADGRSKELINSQITAEVQIGGHTSAETLYEVTLGDYDVVLGLKWLRKHNPHIDWKSGEMILIEAEMQHRVQLQMDAATQPEDEDAAEENTKIELITGKQLAKLARQGNQIFAAEVRCLEGAVKVNSLKADNQPDEVKKADDQPINEIEAEIRQKFAEMFREELPLEMPPDRGVEHRIELVEGAQPQSRGIYRLSYAEQHELKRQLQELTDQGFIRPSQSPWGAPVLFVPKKNGKLRMCIDYRALNKLTVKNSYPIPRIEDLIDQLAGSQIFSKIDLCSGYHQVRVAEADVQKTAFKTRYGLYEFVVLPFGLCNAPATFMRTMNHVLHEYLDKFCVVYLDDILVYSPNISQHKEHLRLIFSRLQEQKLYVSDKKCDIGKQEVEFLGHLISPNGIAVLQDKVQIIQEWPQPKNVSELRSFLGLANYYRKFIKGSSAIARPLTDLLKSSQEWEWTEKQQSAMDQLKQALVSAPVLLIPDPQLPFELTTDASDQAIGAVLTQDHGAGHQPIAYENRKLNSAEQNYPTHEKELLAIVHAVKTWRHYLDAQEFVVHTDHSPLTYLQSQPKLSKRQARWLEVLQELKFSIKYKAGKDNIVADALSRVQHGAECSALQISQVSTDFADRVKAAYQHDAVCQKMIRRPTRGVRWDGNKLLKHIGGGWKWWIPADKELRNQLLQEHHDAPMAGHLGRNKTLKRLQCSFYWPKLTSDVQHYVGKCLQCQRNKANHQKSMGLLQPLPRPDDRWTEISMDFVGPLPKTPRGADFLLVIVDRYSKMIQLIATHQRLKAAELADIFFRHIVRLFGIPEQIVSDRDTRFMSNFWRALWLKCGTQMGLSSSYHPQTDGQTERANKTVEEILRSYVSATGTDWDLQLSAAEFAYNSNVHATTGFTPFYLTFGREPLTPATKFSSFSPAADDWWQR